MNILLHVAAVSLLASTSAFAQTNQGQPKTVPQEASEQQSESQTLRSKVSQQLNRLNTPASENATALTEEIHEKYGFKAQCDSGFIGLFDGLSKTNCLLGLQSLDQALASVNPDVDRTQLSSVTIELTEAGEWQGVTPNEREIKVPYNAHPTRIQQFVNQQVGILFDTSVEELEQNNVSLATDIKENFNYNVIAAPGLSAVEFNEGLKKLRLAAQKSYGSAEISKDEFTKFGFDTVVIAKSYRDLYEDNGELRMNIDSKEKIGQITLQLIQQMHPKQNKFRAALLPHKVNTPSTLPSLSYAKQYDWGKVEEFRSIRAEAKDTSSWLAENYPTRKVECILDSRNEYSVTMRECRNGLLQLRSALEKYGKPESEVAAGKILIGDTLVRSNFYEKSKDALVISDSSSASEIYNSLSAGAKVTPRTYTR